MLRVLSLSVALFLGVTVLAGPATAADQWTTPQRIHGDQATHPHVTSSGSGEIFATYVASSTVAVTRGPDGKWPRERDAVPGWAEGAVVDDAGNVTVAYPVGGHCADYMGSPDPEPFHVEAAFRPAGEQTWRTFRLAGEWNACGETVPELAVDARGTVTALWAGDGSLYVSQRRLGGRWTKSVALGRLRGPAFDVVAAGGRVIAVWSDGDIRSAVSRTFGHWGKPRRIAELRTDYLSAHVGSLDVVGTGRGALLAAWSDLTHRGRQGTWRVRHVSADRHGRWQSPRTVERLSEGKVREVVAAAGGGRVALAWHVQDPSLGEAGPLRVKVRGPKGWSSSKLLDRRADYFGADGLAATDSGGAVVWIAGEPGSHFPLASVRPWSSGWGTPQRLAKSATKLHLPWVVTWKTNVFTAAFPNGREMWASDLRLRR